MLKSDNKKARMRGIILVVFVTIVSRLFACELNSHLTSGEQTVLTCKYERSPEFFRITQLEILETPRNSDMPFLLMSTKGLMDITHKSRRNFKVTRQYFSDDLREVAVELTFNHDLRYTYHNFTCLVLGESDDSQVGIDKCRHYHDLYAKPFSYARSWARKPASSRGPTGRNRRWTISTPRPVVTRGPKRIFRKRWGWSTYWYQRSTTTTPGRRITTASVASTAKAPDTAHQPAASDKGDDDTKLAIVVPVTVSVVLVIGIVIGYIIHRQRRRRRRQQHSVEEKVDEITTRKPRSEQTAEKEPDSSLLPSRDAHQRDSNRQSADPDSWCLSVENPEDDYEDPKGPETETGVSPEHLYEKIK